jgi:hypothetical protein
MAKNPLFSHRDMVEKRLDILFTREETGIVSYSEIVGAFYQYPKSMVKEMLHNLVVDGWLDMRVDDHDEPFYRRTI